MEKLKRKTYVYQSVQNWHSLLRNNSRMKYYFYLCYSETHFFVSGLCPKVRVQHGLQDWALSTEYQAVTMETLAIFRHQHHVTETRAVDVGRQTEQGIWLGGGEGREKGRQRGGVGR